MKNYKIIIIGGGNMGTAVLQSLLRIKGILPKQITVVEHSAKKRKELATKFLVNVNLNLDPEIISRATIVLIAVKPQDFLVVVNGIKNYLSRDSLIVSIMAGVSVATIKLTLNHSSIIRVMPNLPMIVGEGMSVWYATPSVKKEFKFFISSLFNAGGKQIQINDEKKFDAITAVSGSGPAYLFSFVSDLMKAAKSLGLADNLAQNLILQTLKGSLVLLEKNNESAEEWQHRVTSKGGTTEAAFKILQKKRLNFIWLQAIRAAAQKSRTLSTTIDRLFKKW